MNAILAVLMASLFSWWIWSLKQELSHLQEHLPEGDGLSSHLPAQSAIPTHAPVHAPVVARADYPTSPKQRNSTGVPVWTIS